MGDFVEPQGAQLKIRATETAAPAGRDRIALSVFCPERGCSTPLAQCHSCSKCHGWQLDPDARGGRLTCRVVENIGSSLPRMADDGAPSGRQVVNGMQTKVAEVMDGRTLCVEATLPIDELIPLMISRNVSRVPVVDPTGAPLGLVSKTDLLLRKHLDLSYRHRSGIRPVPGTWSSQSSPPEPACPSVRTVRDVVNGGALAVSEATPLARAAALMAYEGVDTLLVISQHGVVVGLLSALDVAQWVALSHGFALNSSGDRSA